MRAQYHILNGDSLRERFPESIQGEIIVARECLVDGNINANSLTDFYKARAEFISSNYDGYKEQDYFEKTVPELIKIQNIPDNVDVNLWFEDDLFCQVNFWFVINLLVKSNKSYPLFLIRPQTHNQYGFGGLTKSELLSIYKNRLELAEINKLVLLWDFYWTDDTEKLRITAQELITSYPFILTAVEAHVERIPTAANGNMGRPIQSLLQITNELNTTEFEVIFREFSKRESIYGSEIYK